MLVLVIILYLSVFYRMQYTEELHPAASQQESLVTTRAFLYYVFAITQRSSKYNPLESTFSFVKLLIVFPYIGDSGSHTF